MTLEGLSHFGAARGVAASRTFVAVNASDGSPLPGVFHAASLPEVEQAARLAGEALADYSRRSGSERGALLRAIAARLEANAAVITARAGLESALAPARLEGELGRTCFQLRLYAAAAESGLAAGVRIDHGDPARKPLPKPDLRAMQVPLGPVAVFGASNFPLAFSVAGGDTASALAAGCPVVVKAHPAHPGTSEIVGKLIREAVAERGLPEGVFSLLFDDGHEVGAALVTNPRIKAVGFTGSLAGGRALMDLAARRADPIPVYAEMGSVNPIFLLGGALADQAETLATGLHASVTNGVGQFCTKPGLVFVEAGEGAERLIAKLAALIEGTAAGTMLTAGMRSSYLRGVAGITGVAGVERRAAVAETAGRAGAALFVTDVATFRAHPELAHEVFGPTTLIVRCSSVAEMAAAAMGLEGQLTATLHARPDELAARRNLVDTLVGKAGRVLFGGFPTGVEVAHAMVHGGPWPASSDGRSTSVGTMALQRFLRPVCYQNFPDAALPSELREENPLGLARLVDGRWQAAKSD